MAWSTADGPQSGDVPAARGPEGPSDDFEMAGDFPGEAVPAPRPPIPFVTIALILAILGMGVLTNALAPSNYDLLRYGGNLRQLTFGGEWWRLLSCAFLHGGALHLGMNLLCLWQLGTVFERLAGRAATAFTFVLSAVVGGACSDLVHPNDIGVGASGGVFGLAGALYVFLWTARVPLGLTRESALGLVRSGLTFVGLNFLFSLQPGVDMTAHAGGLASGALTGFLLAQVLVRRLHAVARMREALLSVATAAIALALVLCSSDPGMVLEPVGSAVRVLRVSDALAAKYYQASPFESKALGRLWAQYQGVVDGDAPFADALESRMLPAERTARRLLEEADVSRFAAEDLAFRARLLEASRLRVEGLELMAEGIRTRTVARSDEARRRLAEALEILEGRDESRAGRASR